MTQQEAAKDPLVHATLGGMNPHFLSSGLSAMPVNANGVPFDMSHFYATGSIAADMMANAMAEGSGRVLASRPYNATDDSGMKDMLSFLIAAIPCINSNGWQSSKATLPILNSVPEEHEALEHSYYFLNTSLDRPAPGGRWSAGPLFDG